MTFSIVARDPVSGQMGVAVQSHWFSVGSVVSWGQAGVGVVATQAFAEPSYGPRGLAGMAEGRDAPDVLAALLAEDPQREARQVAMVDARGNVAAHTGDRCIDEAGHVTGDGFSCQANMMWTGSVWPSMAATFRKTPGDLSDRLPLALVAAQDAGGDVRGIQSSAILVVGPEPTGDPLRDRPLDLRVEDHPDAISELLRLLRLHRAYVHMDMFDTAMETGNEEQAWRQVAAAESLARDNIEVIFWKAVALAKLGREDEARELFERCKVVYEGWPVLLRRLPDAGLFPDDPELIERLLGD